MEMASPRWITSRLDAITSWKKRPHMATFWIMNQDMWILHTVTRIHLWLLIVPTGRMRARGYRWKSWKKKRTVTKYFPGQSLASMQQTTSYLQKEKYSLRKTPWSNWRPQMRMERSSLLQISRLIAGTTLRNLPPRMAMWQTRNRRNSLLSTRAVEPVLQSMRSPLKMSRLR